MAIGIFAVVNMATGQPVNAWVRSYDPTAHDGRGFVEFTRVPAQAKQYATHADAWTEYHQVPANRPLRPDGRPNKPLAAYTVVVQEVPTWPDSFTGYQMGVDWGKGRDYSG